MSGVFRLGLVLGVVLGAAVSAHAQADGSSARAETRTEKTPHVFYSGAGQFEIIVTQVADARPALELGRSVWSALSGPMGLPAEGFSSPVTVRLVPAELWEGTAAFAVTAEPGGLVGVRVRWSEDAGPVAVRRAFVQGLLMRQAVAWHGVNANLTVPLWLEHACTAWSQVHERPAMWDAFQQESAQIGDLPPIQSLLEWQRGSVESRGWELAALWLFAQLQAEGAFSRWGGWVRGTLGGAGPYDTLPRAYAGTWADAASLELWWRTVFQHQIRSRALPVMSADAARAWMLDRSRWLAGRGGREVVLPLDELWALRREPWVQAELRTRTAQVGTIIGVMHPYYANAAISMGRLYEAALRGNEREFQAALKDFERDAVDGRELEETVGAILNTAPRK